MRSRLGARTPWLRYAAAGRPALCGMSASWSSRELTDSARSGRPMRGSTAAAREAEVNYLSACEKVSPFLRGPLGVSFPARTTGARGAECLLRPHRHGSQVAELGMIGQ